MLIRNIFATAACTIMMSASLLMLPGCNQTRSRLFGPSHLADPADLVGTWRAPGGGTIRVSESPGHTVTVRGTAPDGTPTTFTGVLLNVKGRNIIEVPLTDPDKLTPDEAPVYHYGLIQLHGDTLTHQALNPQWLEKMADETEASRAPIQGDDRWVTVGNPKVMRNILEKAVKTDTAWGTKETFERVK